MTNDIEVVVQRTDVSELLLTLSNVDGIRMTIATEQKAEPDVTKRHPNYSLPPDQLAAVIISGAAGATTLLKFATALLDYLKARRAATKAPETPAAAPTININQTTIVLSGFRDPELLAAELAKHLR